MTRHYQDLSSTSDWLKICFNQSKYYTTQIWIVTKIKSIPGGTRSSFHYEGVHVQPYGLKYLAQNSGFLQSLEFLKKSQQFSRPENFFQSYNNKCLISENFCVLVKSYSISPVCLQPIMKKALFLSFLMSLLTTDLSDNLESGKRNYCLGKRSGKSIEFIFWCMCKGVFT